MLIKIKQRFYDIKSKRVLDVGDRVNIDWGEEAVKRGLAESLESSTRDIPIKRKTKRINKKKIETAAIEIEKA